MVSTGRAEEAVVNGKETVLLVEDEEGILIAGFGHHDVRDFLAGDCPASAPQFPDRLAAGT